ncbi:hypothetical protein B0T17DRAFT_601976 [Bombardia bombarda]|uniref:Uncharacterized protein n=1 Tax=Bombardia bombarda TaxID=252184 RepID=A0AA39WIN9_9PEZI|nr:hypothetical protein B0T17DRAFT_601976 [Bombardia bombarda]
MRTSNILLGVGLLGPAQVIECLQYCRDGAAPVCHCPDRISSEGEEDPQLNITPTGGSSTAEPMEYTLLFARVVEDTQLSGASFNPDKIIQLAVESGIDLDNQASVNMDGLGEAQSVQAVAMTTADADAGLDRRVSSSLSGWAATARAKGGELYLRDWKAMVAVFPESRDCKASVGDKVNKCKKKNRLTPIVCEFGRVESAKCEIQRMDIPFCEISRLVATCCEGSRVGAQSMCSAGLSTQDIQEQIQQVQAACNIATAMAKAAIKPYMSGQALGVITELQSVKEISDTVQSVGKVERTRAQFEKWSDGITAAAKDRLQEAKSALGGLASQISPDISNAVAWADAAQAAITRDVDGFLSKAASAANDIDMVVSAKKGIEKPQTAANSMVAIREAATECAKVPWSITPNAFPDWEKVTSWDTLNATVIAYQQHFPGGKKPWFAVMIESRDPRAQEGVLKGIQGKDNLHLNRQHFLKAVFDMERFTKRLVAGYAPSLGDN